MVQASQTCRFFVLGSVGEGKSSLLNYLAANEEFKTSDSVNSCTQTIQDSKPIDQVFCNGDRVVLTDTPGFFDLDMPVPFWMRLYNKSGFGGQKVCRFIWVIKSTHKPDESLQIILRILLFLTGGKDNFQQRVSVVFTFCDEQAKTKNQAMAFLRQISSEFIVNEENVYLYGRPPYKMASRVNLLDQIIQKVPANELYTVLPQTFDMNMFQNELSRGTMSQQAVQLWNQQLELEQTIKQGSTTNDPSQGSRVNRVGDPKIRVQGNLSYVIAYLNGLVDQGIEYHIDVELQQVQQLQAVNAQNQRGGMNQRATRQQEHSSQQFRFRQ